MGFHKNKTMKLEIGKTYLTKHGRFAKIKEEPWEGIFNGEYEKDGRDGFIGRWKTDGRAWNFLFMSGEFYTPEHNVLMEDCDEARVIFEQMKLERKQKAYEETN